MFVVYAFSRALEDFEVVGGFTKREEADAFLATVDSVSKAVVEQSWREALDHAVTVRLGPIAEALTALGVRLDPPHGRYPAAPADCIGSKTV
ncbi:MAG: hypothetical protein V4564_07810 [Pseudomonadota bacterium]